MPNNPLGNLAAQEPEEHVRLVLEGDIEQEPWVGLYPTGEVHREIFDGLLIVRRVADELVFLELDDQMAEGDMNRREVGVDGATDDHGAGGGATAAFVHHAAAHSGL